MSRLGMVLRRIGTIGALVCWFSSSVAADPVRLTWNRFVQGRAVGESLEFGSFENAADKSSDLPGLINVAVTAETTSPDFGLPQLASATATQQTNVSVAGWSGSGTAATDTVPFDPSASGFASAESVLFVEFTLAEPMSYRLTGSISGEGSLADIRLDGPKGLVWIFEGGNPVPLVAMRRGLLSPGDYRFEARAHSEGSGSGRSVFDMDFTLADPVPEPATLFLFGTGAAFVGRRAWGGRREQSAS